MARIRLIHWREAEAAGLLAALVAAGHEVAYVERVGSRLMGHLRQQEPEAVVIDLSRLPSHGRMIGEMIRGSARFGAVPLLFVHGAAEKVAQVRAALPGAVFAADVAGLLAELKAELKAGLKGTKDGGANRTTSVVSPVRAASIARPDRLTSQKLGLAGMVSVVDAPRGYVRALGELPGGVELAEGEQPEHPLTLWWLQDAAHFESRLREARRWAARTKLWILWRKGGKELTQQSIREACAVFGLVDYKICSVDATWSAMLFTVKRGAKPVQ